jgi:uncharacterized damage-inducible protein DinB
MSYLVNDIRAVVSGNAWHGPAWEDVLDGLTARQAAQSVLPGTHSIYELVHHTAAWAAEVARRLDGAQPGMPREGQRVREQLVAAHNKLFDAIERFDVTRLDEVCGTESSAPIGSGQTYRSMLAGLLAHTAYHAGQAMLLRRALEHDRRGASRAGL